MFDTQSLRDTLDNLGPVNEYSFDIRDDKGGDSLASPPVMEIVRFSKDIDNDDYRELMTRYCLVKRSVFIKCSRKKKVVTKVADRDVIKDVITYETLEPVDVGSIQIPDINIIWDSYDIFIDHPLALKFLIDHCVGEILKKLFPSPN